MTRRAPAEVCEISQDGVPTCSTGPLGRLTWTLRELAEMVGMAKRRTRRAR